MFDVPKRELKIFYFFAKKSIKKCLSTDVPAGGDLVLVKRCSQAGGRQGGGEGGLGC